LDNISVNKGVNEEECQHMETFIIPIDGGYIKQCMQCGENIVSKKLVEE
jgi:hypothetical protein